MKYVVFVDIDGVLTTQRAHLSRVNQSYNKWSQFDPVAINFFNRIHDHAPNEIEFVLTTSWKNFVPDYDIGGWNFHWIQAAFANAGFRGTFAELWKTEKEHILPREEGILNYIEDNHVNDYLIFDDNDYGFNDLLPKRRFIKTDPDDGILTKHMRNALAIVGEWKPFT